MSVPKINVLKKISFLFLISFVFLNCATHQLEKNLRTDLKDDAYFKGFVLKDPESNKELINHQGNKYFTPASNTKLFTFYATYRTFKDSVKSLAYFYLGDSVIIKGTADPSFLYNYPSEKVLSFLNKTPDTIYLVDKNIEEPVYGSGWSWDDYPEYYMPEKSLFPIYGNILSINSDSLNFTGHPSHFTNSISSMDSITDTRTFSKNEFFIKKYHKKKYTIPFKTSNELVAKLLSEKLNKRVVLIEDKPWPYQYVYGLSYKELLKEMMVISDNFIAEQLMLQVSKEKTGYYSVRKGIAYTLANYLPKIQQSPRWVDGSGLSRYNLFSPNDMVHLLTKMYKEIPIDELLGYFPVGGESGTLKNWFAIEGKPYVYAKSGTLSNNYNLSGYLKTKKGKILIFSYMNNHYKLSTTKIKQNMEEDLMFIYNNF